MDHGEQELMKKLVFILCFLFALPALAGVGSRIRHPHNYPLNSNAVLGYNKEVDGEEGPWDGWWFFDGRYYPGTTLAHLWCADNEDFEINSDQVTLVVGFQPYFYQSSQGIRRYSLVAKKGYPTGQGWLMEHIYDTNDPTDSTDRDFRAQVNKTITDTRTVNPTVQPGVKSMGVFRYRQSDRQFLIRLYQEGQASLTQGFQGNNYIPINSGTRLHIACEGHTTAPDYSTAEFRGKIFFVAWYKTLFMSGADMDALWNGTKEPTDITNLLLYIDFSKSVAPTYSPEVQAGPNAPYLFNVYGTPIRNGP
jgi:hypothetical protein